MTGVPFIDSDEVQRRLMPLAPLVERYLAGAEIDAGEWTEAIDRIDTPSTYRTRLPGWECEVTVGLAGTVVHHQGGDLVIHGEHYGDEFVDEGAD